MGKKEADFNEKFLKDLEKSLLEKALKEPENKGLTAGDLKFYIETETSHILTIGINLADPKETDVKTLREKFAEDLADGFTREYPKEVSEETIAEQSRQFIETGSKVYDRVTKEHSELINRVTTFYKLRDLGFSFDEALRHYEELFLKMSK